MEIIRKKDFDYLFKILLVGETWTGKTCLFYRYLGDPKNYLEHLDNPSKCAPPTIGVEFGAKNINIEGKVIRLQIWDTSGIEKFIVREYYKSTDGILFIYDISNIYSFENIDYWVRSFEANHKEKSIKILVGNQCDKKYRRVSEEKGKELAEKYGMDYFFETSSKTNKNVNEVFDLLAHKLLILKLQEGEKKEEINLKEKESKSYISRFFSIFSYNNAEKINKEDDNKDTDNKNELIELKEPLNKEKSNNEKLTKKIETLEKELNENKEKQKKQENEYGKFKIESEKKIKELEDKLNKEKNKNESLEQKIKKLVSEKKINDNKNNKDNPDSKESLINLILEKDRELNELKKKLSRYPFELNEGEKMMTVNFLSGNQKIQNYSLICKNSDSFSVLEKKLYEDFKEFYESENYFTVNGNKIHKLKSLDENKIKNNDVIILNVIDI